jgi:hypothetical protein
MNVITNNRIVVIGSNDTEDADIYLALDGSSSKKDIKLFQQYANQRGYTPRLEVDSKWGVETAKAWSVLGKEAQQAYDNAKKVKTASKEKGGSSSSDNKQKAKDLANKGLKTAKDLGIFDLLLSKIGLGQPAETPVAGNDGPPPSENEEKKGMSQNMKIGLGIAAALLVGGVIYAATKSKSK